MGDEVCRDRELSLSAAAKEVGHEFIRLLMEQTSGSQAQDLPADALVTHLAATAWSLGFVKAVLKSFVADGSSTNWGIWERHFKHRSRNTSRLSLRERPAFRGAKGDNQTVIPRTILSIWSSSRSSILFMR